MRDFARSTLRRVAVETRGAEIAEAAAVLPLMFMILLGIFWFGQAFSIYGAITRAAQEGARAGAAPYCATCSGANSATTNAVNAVKTALLASSWTRRRHSLPRCSQAFRPVLADLFPVREGRSAYKPRCS